jgi:ABC-type nitrate/sulfonate/bicarbonate transport system substrate-binding protein
MGLGRYLPVTLVIVLVVTAASYELLSLPASHSAMTLKVGYPDEMDESDVTDLYAFQLLAAEGIQVTYITYDTPPLAYKSLLTGQQDIIYDETMGSLISNQDTTCVGGYELGASFLAVAGDGITNPSQLLGKTAADFGPGSILRDLNYYWFAQAGIPVNTQGPNPHSVYLEDGGENVETLHDLETGQAQEIVVDDFILSDLESPSVNNSAHNGPFHVLFYSPDNIYSSCYAVRDDWLSSPANQLILEKFLSAIYQAQRYFIANPSQYETFAEQQLPDTPPAEIQFASTFYPAQLVYWPYGLFNLQGNESLQTVFNNTNQFFITADVLTKPVANDSVQPYGVINKYFELKALQTISPFSYPDENWVDQSFESDIQSWVPSWMTTAAPNSTMTATG